MLNYIWPIFIIISFVYGIFLGKVEQINSSIFESVENAVNISINLLGTICLWNGIMEIALKTSIIEKFTKILKPVINFLFPELKQDKNIKQEISANIITNILGLGNASTPTGIKVMQSLQKKNIKKDTLTNSMAMFIVINTASLQLVPNTVIAIRNSLGSINPTQILIPIWFSTLCALIVAIFLTKILIKRRN